nr:immunoglobulin light chain junction region [Macaca mulatta]
DYHCSSYAGTGTYIF